MGQNLPEASDKSNNNNPNFEKARFVLEDWDADLLLGRLIRPMLQAYTISLPIRRLDELGVNWVSENFPCLSHEFYSSLNAVNLDESSGSSFPEWII
jgi:hypothetical protein